MVLRTRTTGILSALGAKQRVCFSRLVGTRAGGLLLLMVVGMALSLVKAQSVEPPERSSTPEYVIYFRAGKWDIDPTYMTNSAVLERMKQIVTRQNIPYIDSLIVSAYASPEASAAYNKQLSEKRALAVRAYFLKRFSMLHPSSVHSYGHGENWDGLLGMVQEDRMLPQRDAVLAIMAGNRHQDEKEAQLKALKQAYPYIRDNYYPRLRVGASLHVMLTQEAPDKLRVLVSGLHLRPLSVPSVPVPVDTFARPVLAPLPLFNHPRDTVRYRRPLALKTNLLFDLATLFNIEVEVPLGRRFSVLAEWTFPFWGGLGNAGGVAPVPSYSNNYTLQMLSGGIEGRYWFPRSNRLDKKAQRWGDYNPLNGWFVGLFGGAGVYDAQFFSPHGMQGEFYIASGISGGFAHPIARHWHMEYSLGFGYIATRYYNYTLMDGHKVVDIRPDGQYDRRQQSLIGPTKLKISLVWIPQFKTRSTK